MHSFLRFWHFFICSCFIPFYSVFPQTDTLYRTVAKQEAINLNLLWYSINYGNISWEKSLNGINWYQIPEESTKNYRFNAETNAYFRARVNAGTCDPLYSKIVKINVLNISTDSVTNVTETEAVVHCTSHADTLIYHEKGILLDIKPLPDLLSTKIIDTSGQINFNIHITNLQQGVTYYARIFLKDQAGVYYYGNILTFSTQKICFTNIVNCEKTSLQIFYDFSATPFPAEHGIFFSMSPDVDTTDTRIQGTENETYYFVSISDLLPGTTYYALPYMKVNGRYYLGEEKAFTTFSDYSVFPVNNDPFTVQHKIVWNDPSTARKISQDGYFADYGRVKRVGTSDTLILVYQGGPNNGDWVNVCMRMSYDNGNTWTNQRILMNIEDYIDKYWRFCTPEVLVLKNGWVLLAFEANAKPDENKSSVQILISKDTCKTWEGPVIYVTGRSWEPAMVELPNGEIELFYSSEAKWWPNEPIYQEIIQICSTDKGYSWSQPRTVAYYPYKRDGMPVPLLLQGNKGVVFAIETVNSTVSPFIVKRDLASQWILTTSNFTNSPWRWVVSNFSGHGGAPYLLQLPTGEVVLSAHIYRGGDWHQNNYMQVMIGDNNAKNFSQLTTPWGVLPLNQSAVNNSLFLKDNETIVAISCRMFPDGSGGIYWLEGKIVPIN